MSLSAAASALAPCPEAERLSEAGHALLARDRAGNPPTEDARRRARLCFAQAVTLTKGKDKVYCFALGQACLGLRDIQGAVRAFRFAAAAAPDWFAPREALKMLGYELVESKSTAAADSSGQKK